MKKLLLLITVLSTIMSAAQAQAPGIQWTKALGGTNAEEAYSILQTADEGYILVGNTKSYDGDIIGNHGGYSDAWVVKLSNSGDLEWQKTLGGSAEDGIYSIQQTTDGGYIVAGYTTSNDGDVIGNHGQFDAWVVKLSSSGAIEWQRAFGGTADEWISSIQQTTDGGYVFAGYSWSISGDIPTYIGNTAAWVVKISAAGIIEWQKALGGVAGDRLYNIRQTADGGYVTVGYTNSVHADGSAAYGDFDCCVTKLSPTGTIVWKKGFGGTADDYAYDIQQTSDNGYIVAGSTESNDFQVSGNHGYEDIWIFKISDTGALQWQKTFGGTDHDRPYSIQKITEGNYIFAGQTWSADGDISLNHGAQDGWIVEISDSADIIWQKTVGGYSMDILQSIQPTADGSCVAVGYAASLDGDVAGNHGSFDSWVVKLDPKLATETFNNQAFRLFPNPANQFLNIQNPNNEFIEKITVSDLTGKILIEQSGNLSEIDVLFLPQGMYFIQILSQGKTTTQKFIKD
ncbi:T9SS type A sorting domain-containing protein [Flavobacterium sp.]|uniref:T9SS type A sorting domain-containing protein n=1 Tax=Flavobacterium sp. TaxID=239 RepID=UPI002610C6EC|nr:T9SS type A sorting domain-containing protein [Flavobacterium sp.]